MANELIGSSTWLEFLFGTVLLFGWGSYMAAQALGRTWRPWTHCLFYGTLLGVASRLFDFLLFHGPLLSLRGLVVNMAYVLAVMLIAHRRMLSRMMVMQYPWLYEPAGPFAWREKEPGTPG
ncbi:MAG TPA: hypothetical protein VJ487_03490 [Alphaproteobacteria bacterium]|nr:hypothetical protein [Alphaproteobacteria bacterium]